MEFKQLTDWDSEYSNADHIPNGLEFPKRWSEQAARFRDETEAELDISYGHSDREVFDLFLPTVNPVGLFVFVHGGYWVRFDKSYWSHFAKGFIESGWAVAIPSYQLCPDVTIAYIEKQIANAVDTAAAKISGPIILGGHSAGGQLVSSIVCENTPLTDSTLSRIEHVVSISGVHDLRPLLNTELNKSLKLDRRSALEASPALKNPLPATRLTALVGANERPEFVRQSALLANIWLGCGANVRCIEVPDRHHFDVIDILQDGSNDYVRGLVKSQC